MFSPPQGCLPRLICDQWSTGSIWPTVGARFCRLFPLGETISPLLDCTEPLDSPPELQILRFLLVVFLLLLTRESPSITELAESLVVIDLLKSYLGFCYSPLSIYFRSMYFSSGVYLKLPSRRVTPSGDVDGDCDCLLVPPFLIGTSSDVRIS